jgi:hypothetical protein
MNIDLSNMGFDSLLSECMAHVIEAVVTGNENWPKTKSEFATHFGASLSSITRFDQARGKADRKHRNYQPLDAIEFANRKLKKERATFKHELIGNLQHADSAIAQVLKLIDANRLESQADDVGEFMRDLNYSIRCFRKAFAQIKSGMDPDNIIRDLGTSGALSILTKYNVQLDFSMDQKNAE